MSDSNYLIIAGTTKAGSTSLFRYLADHPQICASKIKETRFFLDQDYPQARIRNISGIYQYEDYFENCSDQQIRLDGSPQYLYSPGSPRRIRNAIPEVRLVFILRNPIERLISFYKFAKLRTLIQRKTTFSEYVLSQLNRSPDDIYLADYDMAVAHGRYSKYLSVYLDFFDAEQIHVDTLENLRRNPTRFLKSIARLIDIDPEFYNHHEYHIYNESRDLRSVRLQKFYKSIRHSFSLDLLERKKLWTTLDLVHRKIRPMYLSLNSRSSRELTIPDEIMKQLDEYYRDEEDDLFRILGKRFLWKDENNIRGLIPSRKSGHDI